MWLGPLPHTFLFAGHNRYLFEVFPGNLKEVSGTTFQVSLVIEGNREAQDSLIIFGLRYVLSNFLATNTPVLCSLINCRQQDIHGLIGRWAKATEYIVCSLKYLDIAPCLWNGIDIWPKVIHIGTFCCALGGLDKIFLITGPLGSKEGSLNPQLLCLPHAYGLIRSSSSNKE